ncbi:hypothetical protein [Desulfonatronum thioautotrophicum]|uniref:hypothetical protein n=1 Tax=Desulfonatronum thioautotrophicum TaxID=617001 RepID=UPI00069A7D64|nr:hypothetical protein [Desulfonatronum thioautotrophicum]
MKFPLRIFGEVEGLDPDKLDELRVLLNPEIFFPRNGGLDVEYEGPYLDIEPDLDELVAALADGGQGHVDCIDHENWELRRYSLQPDSWTCKKINPDGALERYHHE